MGFESTPTVNAVPLRAADFATLAEALDYAAQGVTGFNFYSGKGELYAALPYAELREQARFVARRLLSLDLPRGSRVALIADTHPDFMLGFFACQYAGLYPVPLPLSINLGSQQAYIEQLRRLLLSCRASVGVAPKGYVPYLEQAAEGLGMRFIGRLKDFKTLPPQPEFALQPLQAHETAYLQYTSGSTRFPRGVMITQSAVLANLAGIIRHGVQVVPGDRCMSWLPYYHDMGLVGQILAPLASQMSVDYLGTREFAMRPRQWLALMARNRATISFGPPFGYELVARRLREGEAEQYDLSAWRVAGVGAEMIRADILDHFAIALAPSGFRREAFLPCYGMAEASLAISFADLNQTLAVDCVNADRLAEQRRVTRIHTDDVAVRSSHFVLCGKPLPDMEVEIRAEQGHALPADHLGAIHLRGPSLMSGYFNDPETTRACLSDDGWLDTGDIGYRTPDGQLVITGRKKDMIIINGRNVWPQDLEALAEQQPEVRTADALAFAAPGPNGGDVTVLVVQCRTSDSTLRRSLIERLKTLTRAELGIDCFVQLVPLHTLPRTSSGKLSRSRARQNFIDAHQWQNDSLVANEKG